MRSQSDRGGSPVSIDVRDLSKHYEVHRKAPGVLGSLRGLVSRTNDTVRAVDGVSFQIAEGEIVGFLGPNGAGKTTTLKLLSGLLHPTAGHARVLGFDPWKRDHAYLRQLSLVMGQKNQLWWDIPAMETFLLNREIYEIPGPVFRETLTELVDLLDLGRILSVQVRRLSLGERMKCELAAALLHRPRVLFLDEPTIGLDVVMQKAIRQFVDHYRRRFGATIVLTSHYMDDVKELCERIIIIDRGRVIYDGALAEVSSVYAAYRVITVRFERVVGNAELDGFGTVASFDGFTATLHIPRADVSTQAARLLASLPVADVTIEEPAIDDVIRHVFSASERDRDAKSRETSPVGT
ncbi:MAG: ATP-binding cassette domain-containing protein [Chloroflexi bacterium]|nr:ATP-binding cassette domain-containing protein [Chloroflexota bacterium]